LAEAAAAYSGVRPVIVVIFMNDLEPSVRFYSGLLAMEVTASDDNAAVLGSADAAQLHLRRVGPGCVLPVGDLDRRYVAWTATDDKDLRRCARFLQASSAPVRVLTRNGITFVEGQDPSGRPVTITYPGLDHIAGRRIWRIDDYRG
jgi:catechol 2,3-dioxygenase-like lactoylglutathione lyase family enzyme